MKLSTIKGRIPNWYLAGKCIYLKSPPGRGKTTVLVEAAADVGKRLGKNLGTVVINGPLLTPADSIGYLVPKHYEGYTESVYTSPFWWRTAEGKRLEEYDGGFIIVDEADKMDTDVKKVIGEAALSGRLGPHVLPKGWVIWMAGNRTEDRSGSTKELDHLINRRMEIDVTDDVESLLEWMAANGVQPITQAFTKQNPHIVLPNKVPEKQGPFCTPRSVVAADSYLKVLGESLGSVPDDPATIEEVTGMIGGGPAAQLFSFVRLEREMPSFEEIKSKPGTCRVPAKADAQMLVTYNLAHRVDKESVTPVMEYMARMGKEFSVTFVVAACRREFTLMNVPIITKWSNENAALMAAVSK